MTCLCRHPYQAWVNRRPSCLVLAGRRLFFLPMPYLESIKAPSPIRFFQPFYLCTYRPARNGGLWVADVCPACHEGSLWVAPVGKRVRLACMVGGCSQEAVLDRLAEEPT